MRLQSHVSGFPQRSHRAFLEAEIWIAGFPIPPAVVHPGRLETFGSMLQDQTDCDHHQPGTSGLSVDPSIDRLESLDSIKYSLR